MKKIMTFLKYLRDMFRKGFEFEQLKKDYESLISNLDIKDYSNKKSLLLKFLKEMNETERKYYIMLSIYNLYMDKYGISLKDFSPDYKVVKDQSLTIERKEWILQAIGVFFGIENMDFELDRRTTVRKIAKKVYKKLYPKNILFSAQKNHIVFLANRGRL